MGRTSGTGHQDGRSSVLKEDPLLIHLRNKGEKYVHECPDWDFLIICERDPEFESCTCDKASLLSQA